MAQQPQPQQQQQQHPSSEPSAKRTIVPIKIKQGDRRADFKTFLSYGRSRSGKTRFLASWPRPLIIADATERGWDTIESMPVDDFYEPEVMPLVWPVEDALQMSEAIRDAKPLVDRGEVFTIGVDSLTFYSDSYFMWIKRKTAELNPGKQVDTRALYGALAEHMKIMRIDIHKWPCNVGWLALDQIDEKGRGAPMLSGKAREQFPAGCSYCFYHRAYTAIDTEGVEGRFFEMHCQPFENYVAGGRDSGKLPPSLFNPSYRQMAEMLELADPIEAFKASRGR